MFLASQLHFFLNKYIFEHKWGQREKKKPHRTLDNNTTVEVKQIFFSQFEYNYFVH